MAAMKAAPKANRMIEVIVNASFEKRYVSLVDMASIVGLALQKCHTWLCLSNPGAVGGRMNAISAMIRIIRVVFILNASSRRWGASLLLTGTV